jgi:hypothetical protein
LSFKFNKEVISHQGIEKGLSEFYPHLPNCKNLMGAIVIVIIQTHKRSIQWKKNTTTWKQKSRPNADTD